MSEIKRNKTEIRHGLFGAGSGGMLLAPVVFQKNGIVRIKPLTKKKRKWTGRI